MTATEPPAAPAPPVAAETPVAFAARAVPLVVAGYLLGDWIGAVAAAAGVASTFRRPATLAAGGAAAALVVAALATVIEVPVDEDALRSSFALDRPVAAGAGLVAAVLALVAVVTLGVRERPAAAAAPAAAPTDPLRSRLAALAPLAPVVGVALAAGLVLAVAAPSPPSATRSVATSVRLGLGWGVAGDAGVAVDGTEPPLPVVVAAVAPGGAGLWTGVAGLGAALVVGLLVRRLRGERAALVAAAVVGVGLVVARADLAGALAALLVAGALALGDPDGRTAGRAALAGALFGGAALCLPAAALLLPLVVAALALDPRPGARGGREVTVGHGLAGLVAAVVVLAPWQRWIVERFATWAPAAELQVPLPAAVGLLLPLLALAVALVALPRLTGPQP